jgi:hypothetical protein
MSNDGPALSTDVMSSVQNTASVITAQDTEQNTDSLAYIASKVKQHQCVLFLGAAIHAPAPRGSQYVYPKKAGPPKGSVLSRYLARRCGYRGADRWNLQRVAQRYESRLKFRSRLVEEIERVVDTDRRPSPVLYALSELGFPIVITTNYDHLYERALGKHANDYDVCIYSPDNRVKTKDCAQNPSPARPYILKIHGDISAPESIVITEEDYIDFILRMGDKHPYHPVGRNVLTYLAKWPTLFIGYSLLDYNFRVLFKSIRWRLAAARVPPNYSVDVKPDDLIRDIYENQNPYVTFIVENLWDFVPKLYRAVKDAEMPHGRAAKE